MKEAEQNNEAQRGMRNQGHIDMPLEAPTFRGQLEDIINKHSEENGSNTPDYILALYLADCLSAFNKAVNLREQWYGRTNPESISL